MKEEVGRECMQAGRVCQLKCSAELLPPGLAPWVHLRAFGRSERWSTYLTLVWTHSYAIIIGVVGVPEGFTPFPWQEPCRCRLVA
jgi:hypothetical protein